MRASHLLMALAVAAPLAQAQLAPVDPDWREVEAPPPPAVKLEGLVPLEVPGSTLRFGVDPASISIGDDGIVRYVVVASASGGAVNGLYEGLRCSTGEVKVYARHNAGSGWVIARNAAWQSLHGAAGARHSLVIARSGACLGRTPNRPAGQIVRDLRSPATTRFNQPP